MSMDLIITDTGHVMIANDEAFPDEVTRIDLDCTKRRITLNYKRHAPGWEVLNIDIHERMMTALLAASSVLLLHVKEGRAEQGYDVPIICTDV